MPHDVSLIALLAAGFGLAMVFGYFASLLKMPPLVGYLLAGIVIGPGTPGFVGDLSLAQQLAEVGVMLLMFGVGLHFSLGDLLAVRKIALPGAIVQITVATLLGGGRAHLGLERRRGARVQLALSVASTVVLLRALEGRGLVETVNGRIAVGWLVVEDLVMVLVLVLLPPVAGLLGGTPPGDAQAAGGSVWGTLGVTMLKVAAFIALMLVVGKRVFPRILWLVARTGSRELFTLCMIAAAVGIAFGAAKLFDVSFALGAFFAGMMMRESEFSRRAADETLPLRDAFSVLFFISVGMLFDPKILLAEPLHVIEVAAIVVIGKTLAAVALVIAFRYPLNTALTVGAGPRRSASSRSSSPARPCARAAVGRGQSLILAVALISIAMNTLLFAMIDPALAWIRKHSAFARKLEARDDPLAALPMSTPQTHLTGQVVIVGYGKVGTRIAHALDERGIAYVVVEQNRGFVEKLREDGVAAVSGDAIEPIVLVQAHIARAGMLVVTLPDVFDVRQIVEISRTLNPALEVVLCTNSGDEAALLSSEGSAPCSWARPNSRAG